MGRAGQNVPVRGLTAQDAVEPPPGGDDPLHGSVHLGPRHVAAGQGRRQVLGPDHPVGHLQVQPGMERPRRVSQSQDPVADDEPLESPLVPQDVGQQHPVLTAPLAVDAVVGTHDHGHALVDDPLEVGQVDVVQGGLVHRNVHGEAGVLHRVAGEMLDAGHGVALYAAGQCGTHLPYVVGVLAVGLLSPAPGRMAQDVDAHAAVQVGPDGPELGADGLADPLLELHVPGGAPGHAHREAGGPVHHHAPRSVGEGHSGQAQPLHPRGPEGALVVALLAQIRQAGPERRVAVQAPQLLVGGHRGHRGGDVVRRRTLGRGLEAPGAAGRGLSGPFEVHRIRVPSSERVSGAGEEESGATRLSQAAATGRSNQRWRERGRHGRPEK